MKEKKFPAIKVKNYVTYKNENINLPFELEIGKQSEFGLLLSLDDSTIEKDFMLGVKKGHGRTSDASNFLSGNHFIRDKNGNLYRDINLKGTGWVGQKWQRGEALDELEVVQWTYWDNEPSRMMGLLDEKDAQKDIKFNELFRTNEIRTHCNIALIKLEELNIGKEIYPVDEIKRASLDGRIRDIYEGYLPYDFYPVVQVRAFGIEDRLVDIEKEREDDKEICKEKIRDTLSFLKEELNGKNFEIKEYVEWFSQTLGKNVGIMHKKGLLHKYLNIYNITLDCRITDLDSVTEIEDIKEEKLKELMRLDAIGEKDYHSQYVGALDAIQIWYSRMQELFPEELKDADIKDLENMYLESYKELSGGNFLNL